MALAVPQNSLLAKLHANRGMIFPVAFISLLLVILIPLPTFVLDLLLVMNITLSVIVLVTTIYVKSPLEFAVFPSLLLAVTLFRLVLNVATTRLILTAGDRASDPKAAVHQAGEVVMAFSAFVTSGSLAVGVIIFIIIFVIQFVVITKGGGRISEVAARFTLDAMPGKQMAIDADLNAGHITEAQARERREAIAQEADFYGAMDGASKFVRGDAIAGIVITIVNILGGLYVGMVDKHWDIMPCLQLYTKLTIGDGLVSQLPAFIVSLGAGLIVTRSGSKSNLGDQMLAQVFSQQGPDRGGRLPRADVLHRPAEDPAAGPRLLLRRAGVHHDPHPAPSRQGRRRERARESRRPDERTGQGREAARSRHDGTRGRLRPDQYRRERPVRRSARAMS